MYDPAGKRALKSFTCPKFLFFAIMFMVSFVAWAGAVEQEPVKKKFPAARRYTIKKADSKIKIDGVLDERAWSEAEKIGISYEWMPGDNIRPPVKSECMVTYDKSKLYVAFRCFDHNPGEIRAHLMDRDSIETFVQDDHVGFMIDTFNDERRGFQFRINPLGVQADAIFSELEGYEDFSWDAIWDSAGKITGSGYIVEVAIPFNQLRFPKDNGVQTWGFEAVRSYPRNARHRISSHVRDRDMSCVLCQFNKITGFDGISPGKNMEFAPTLTATRTDTRDDFPSGEMHNGKVGFEPGLSMRWGISPNVTLNAAVNPDFSQVEADVAQLDVNNRFALRYPEKRPFFLEGADFFVTPIEAVFTRTVYEPAWGAKMSGKMGKNAVGFFVTQDRRNALMFPSNEGSVKTSFDDGVFAGVFRYRRDVGKGSTVGALYTGRTGEDYYNHVGGVDGFFRLSPANTLSVQYLYSRTDYPEEVADQFGQDKEAFGGSALFARLVHRSRNWIIYATYTGLSDGFRSDSGFVPRVDIKKVEARVNPIIWGKKGGWFDRLGFMVHVINITDDNNTLTDRDILLVASYTGALQTYLEGGYVIRKEHYQGTLHDANHGYVYLNMRPMNGFQLKFSGKIGDSIDYTNARVAQSLLLNPGVEFGLGRHLNVNFDHNYQQLSLGGKKIVTANLLQAKFVYTLNVRTFVRAIFQYTHINRNLDLYLLPLKSTTKALFTQFLFSYKLNPQTVLFLGYSDNHLGYKGIDILRTNRTFFLKIGYALVL